MVAKPGTGRGKRRLVNRPWPQTPAIRERRMERRGRADGDASSGLTANPDRGRRAAARVRRAGIRSRNRSARRGISPRADARRILCARARLLRPAYYRKTGKKSEQRAHGPSARPSVIALQHKHCTRYANSGPGAPAIRRNAIRAHTSVTQTGRAQGLGSGKRRAGRAVNRSKTRKRRL